MMVDEVVVVLSEGMEEDEQKGKGRKAEHEQNEYSPRNSGGWFFFSSRKGNFESEGTLPLSRVPQTKEKKKIRIHFTHVFFQPL